MAENVTKPPPISDEPPWQSEGSLQLGYYTITPEDVGRIYRVTFGEEFAFDKINGAQIAPDLDSQTFDRRVIKFLPVLTKVLGLSELKGSTQVLEIIRDLLIGLTFNSSCEDALASYLLSKVKFDEIVDDLYKADLEMSNSWRISQGLPPVSLEEHKKGCMTPEHFDNVHCGFIAEFLLTIHAFYSMMYNVCLLTEQRRSMFVELNITPIFSRVQRAINILHAVPYPQPLEEAQQTEEAQRKKKAPNPNRKLLSVFGFAAGEIDYSNPPQPHSMYWRLDEADTNASDAKRQRLDFFDELE